MKTKLLRKIRRRFEIKDVSKMHSETHMLFDKKTNEYRMCLDLRNTIEFTVHLMFNYDRASYIIRENNNIREQRKLRAIFNKGKY